MDIMEAMFWLAILQQANEGDKEIIELLRQENELRAETNRPSVEEELKAVADRAK